MQKSETDYFEVDLSEERGEPQKQDLDNLVEIDFSKEKLPFKEKMGICEEKLTQVMDEHKVYSFMLRRNLLSDEVKVTEGDFFRTEKKIAKEYISLVCNATDKEYQAWVNHTLELLIGALKPEIKKEDDLDPDHVSGRLELFRDARDARIAYKSKKNIRKVN